ncbi:MAG: hypothetical protein IOC32_05390, partial [Burkholderia sp.]|nr:hypothetical protein [Burkholderia sp.]
MSVGRHELKRFVSCLSDQQSIEWIAMVVRQITHRGPVHGPNRQLANPACSDCT